VKQNLKHVVQNAIANQPYDSFVGVLCVNLMGLNAMELWRDSMSEPAFLKSLLQIWDFAMVNRIPREELEVKFRTIYQKYFIMKSKADIEAEIKRLEEIPYGNSEGDVFGKQARIHALRWVLK
jgi:hypothetical protein